MWYHGVLSHHCNNCIHPSCCIIQSLFKCESNSISSLIVEFFQEKNYILAYDWSINWISMFYDHSNDLVIPEGVIHVAVLIITDH